MGVRLVVAVTDGDWLSLLVRALTPMQLFGLRKTPDLSLASPQLSPVVATGSDPATGGCLDQPPFADSVTFAGHKAALWISQPAAKLRQESDMPAARRAKVASH